MKRGTTWICAMLMTFCVGAVAGSMQEVHVWEKVEITLTSMLPYSNPYTDVSVWVDLAGPGFQKRCYGFWDGGNTYRVRVVATAPGRWSWRSGSNKKDPGLQGRTGSFTAIDWTEADKQANPLRRGFIRPTPNGHAFQYADETPFFLIGDTWWPVPTFRYRWYDDDKERPIGPGMGLKDAIRYRKPQGFNCIAMIAAHPAWHNDGKPPQLRMEDGTVIRAAWAQDGTKSAKTMTDEAGNRPFEFPGKVPGFEEIVPDLDRINPAYFQSMDRKIDYLNSQGFVPFIEPARRDIGQVWKKFHKWPDSYSRYVQYIWSRYQANNCLFSPIHYDWSGQSIPAEDWNAAGNQVIERYGPPPFGTLVGCNSSGSSLENFGHVDKAKWVTFHQIGNANRDHSSYRRLTDIFNAKPPIPGINGEPYYDGWGPNAGEGGSDQSALFARSAMYGSTLSGGLGGYIHGAGGTWPGNVEPEAKQKLWEAIQWPAGRQLPNLATFVLSEGTKYRDLVPQRDLVSPNDSGDPKGWTRWAYCSRTDDKSLFLLYFEKGCPKATLSGAKAGAEYKAQWFNPRKGEWIDAGQLRADNSGKIVLPDFPGGEAESSIDWAVKLTEND